MSTSETTTSPQAAACAAFNAAFEDLGFDWQWDAELYASLAAITDERERLCTYLREQQSHLLKAYDLGFLCDAILEAREHHRNPLRVAA